MVFRIELPGFISSKIERIFLLWKSDQKNRPLKTDMVHQTFTQSNCYAFKMWTFSKVYEYWANDFQLFAVFCIHTANGGILIHHIKNIDMTDMTLKEQPLNLHFFVVQGLKCHPFGGFRFSLYMSNPGSENQVVLPPPLKTRKSRWVSSLVQRFSALFLEGLNATRLPRHFTVQPAPTVTKAFPALPPVPRSIVGVMGGTFDVGSEIFVVERCTGWSCVFFPKEGRRCSSLIVSSI